MRLSLISFDLATVVSSTRVVDRRAASAGGTPRGSARGAMQQCPNNDRLRRASPHPLIDINSRSSRLAPVPREANAASWRRRARPLLGTIVEVAACTTDEPAYRRAADAAFGCVARYHAAMSFHEAGSDVRAIAAARRGATLDLAPETRHVIAAALALSAQSDGIFDVGVGAELVARGRLPMPPVSCPGTAALAAEALRLEDDGRLTVLRPIWIDLGGIAKGAAVDAAVAAMGDAGLSIVRVNAGGDLALRGGEPQRIAVRGPDGVLVDAGALADGAIATSGPYAGSSDQDASALVVRGRRARWVDRAVSVVAPSCLIADALTKVVAILGPDAAPLLRRHDAQGFSVDASGRLERVA